MAEYLAGIQDELRVEVEAHSSLRASATVEIDEVYSSMAEMDDDPEEGTIAASDGSTLLALTIQKEAPDSIGDHSDDDTNLESGH